MHTYSTDNELRPKVYWAISLGSYFLAGAIGAAATYFSENLALGIAVSIPAAVTFSATLTVYDRWIWNWGLLRKLNVTRVPDLSGKWKGSLDSNHQNTSMEPVLTIKQTWRKISVHLETENSGSNSYGATFRTQYRHFPKLVYEYRNEGSRTPGDGMSPHEGTAKFKYRGEDDVLLGEYYTDPSRGNAGEMEFERVSEDSSE